MSRQTTQAALIGLVVIAALSGCSATAPAPQPAAASAAGPDFVTVLEPTWTTEAALVGTPVVENGFVASYVAVAGGTLDVVAWNAATGAEVWRDVASVGAVSAGRSITLGSLESGGTSFVTYLTSIVGDDTGWRELVVAEIGTGITTPITDGVVWATRLPTVCTDGLAVCFTGNLESDGADPAIFRLDPKVGTIVAETDVVIPSGAYLLSDRLFNNGERTPDGVEQLGYAADGAVAWQRPYSEIFAEGYSSDGGFNWDLSGSDEVIVGIGSYVDPNRASSGAGVVDLTQTMTVGLDPASGDTVWTLEGTSICAASYISLDLLDGVNPMCRYNSGTRTTAPGADGSTLETTDADVDIDLLGVNALTGAIEWTLPLGGASATAVTDAFFGTLSAFRPVEVAGTVSLVDALTGDVADLPGDALFGCLRPRADFEMLKPGSSDLVLYSAGYSASPCTGDMGTIDGAVFSAGALGMVAAAAGGNTYVVAGASTLSLYTLTD